MTSIKSGNIQDALLNSLRREGSYVNLFLVNGFQMRRVKIMSFDSFVILIETEKGPSMVYKHAISSVEFEKLPKSMYAKDDKTGEYTDE